MLSLGFQVQYSIRWVAGQQEKDKLFSDSCIVWSTNRVDSTRHPTTSNACHLSEQCRMFELAVCQTIELDIERKSVQSCHQGYFEESQI
jgi:hypothetical protein